MKKIFLILILLIIGAFFFGGDFLSTFEDPEPRDLSVEFLPDEGMEAQEITVVEEEETVFSLEIEELNSWMEENWDRFDDPPTVAMRDIDPGGFGFFDRAASISPGGERLIFSVSDYAAATTTSIVVVADLETQELDLITDPVRGSVEAYAWKNDRVAYTIGTARAGGDFLRIDDLTEMRVGFELSEEDLVVFLDSEVEEGQYMPAFRDLNWDGDFLEFTTSDPDTEEDLHWRINFEGVDLELK